MKNRKVSEVNRNMKTPFSISHRKRRRGGERERERETIKSVVNEVGVKRMCWMLNISTLVARVARYRFRCVALLLEAKRNQHHPELCVCLCARVLLSCNRTNVLWTIAKAKIIIISRMRWKESCSRNRETAAWRQVNTEPNKRNGIIGIWLSHINECCILVCSHCMASVLLLFFVHVVLYSVVGYCFQKAMRRH